MVNGENGGNPLPFSRWLKWYYATRAMGATIILYELFSSANSPERGTIILAGVGLFCTDFVARKRDE